MDRDDLIKWNEFCRHRTTTSVNARGVHTETPSPIVFIAADTFGPMGYVFSDFGDTFVVQDEFGEPAIERTITSISNAKEGVVTIVNPEESELARPLDMDDDDHTGFVTFDEVKGMYAKKETNIGALGHSLNNSGAWKVMPVYTDVPLRQKNGKTGQKEEAFWVYKRGKDGEYEVDKDTEKRKEKPVYRVSDM